MLSLIARGGVVGRKRIRSAFLGQCGFIRVHDMSHVACDSIGTDDTAIAKSLPLVFEFFEDKPCDIVEEQQRKRIPLSNTSQNREAIALATAI